MSNLNNIIINRNIKLARSLLVLTVISTLLLSACTKPAIQQYNANDFIAPTRVVTQTVTKPVLPNIDASYGIGNESL